LLELENIDYFSLKGKKRDSLFGKGMMQVMYNLFLWRLVRRWRIEIAVGTSVTIAQITPFCRIKSIFLDDDDDEVEPLVVKYAHPFCSAVLSPDVLQGKRKARQTVFYRGTHELAYLHPNRFTPDKATLAMAGLNENEPYFVIRFNVFKAHHDGHVHGLTLEQKLRLIELLSRYGRVLITTEREAEPELEPYRLPVPPDKIHDLLAFATLFLGDSQTMTAEAAVLGTPALRCNTLVGEISYLADLENNFGMAFGYKPEQFEQMLQKAEQLLQQPDLKSRWQEKRRAFLSERIDTTAFLVDFIEQFPGSKKH
jgi:predicted glycosyltransferase